MIKAMKSQDVALWKEVINDEMDSIMGNNTLGVADLPPGCKPLGCKWIFKRKLKVDGNVLNAQGKASSIQALNKKSEIKYLILMLQWFSMKDMGEADVILALEKFTLMHLDQQTTETFVGQWLGNLPCSAKVQSCIQENKLASLFNNRILNLWPLQLAVMKLNGEETRFFRFYYGPNL
ncbi:hypothetical protein Tco_0201951 [Tanacetum coccineum]